MYDRLILCGRGFSQDFGECSGVDLFNNVLYERYSSKTCRVLPAFNWHCRTRELAHWISGNLKPEARIDVGMAYSNGGGVWFPSFQRRMSQLSRKIHTVNLVDPVNLGGRLNPRRWFGGGQTSVTNAEDLTVYTQSVNHPRSAGVEWTGGSPRIMTVNVHHSHMDNNELTWQDCLAQLEKPQ